MEPQQIRPGVPPPRTGEFGYVTHRMVQLLRATRPWVRFMAAYGFVMSVLLLLGALSLMIYVVITPGRLGGLMAVAIAYAVISIVTLICAFPLHRYASFIRQIEAGGRERALEEALASQKDFWQITGILTAMSLVAAVLSLLAFGLPAFRKASDLARSTLPRTAPREPAQEREEEPAQEPSRPEREAREPSRRVEGEPASSSTGTSSPGAALRFGDLEAACGDIRARNFLCLVNQGSEEVAGGARSVTTDADATFQPRPQYGNAISITIEGKRRYRIEIGPPKGKALIPGLYTGAERWPFNEGPAPGLDISIDSSGCNQSEGQFRIHEIEISDGRVRRLLADFDGGCSGSGLNGGHTIGRISVTDDTPGPSSPGA